MAWQSVLVYLAFGFGILLFLFDLMHTVLIINDKDQPDPYGASYWYRAVTSGVNAGLLVFILIGFVIAFAYAKDRMP